MATLKEQVREAARIAKQESIQDDFNAMSWLDLLLEDNPQCFDCFFDAAWDELSDQEQEQRAMAIRKVL